MSGLVVAPRFVILVLLGLIPATIAMFVDSFSIIAVAWNLLLVTALIVDGFSVPKKAHVDATRSLRAHLQHGEEERVVVSLRASRDARAWVIDEPPQALVPRNIVEYPRSLRLVAGGATQIDYPVRARRRGRFEFAKVNVLARGPLGLMQRRIVLDARGTSVVDVYPRVFQSHRDTLDADLMVAELGIKRVRRRAEGTEFESLRDAVLEDELRRIDWRATGRRGKLTARNYELERNHEVVLCLDTSRLMGALVESPVAADAVSETKLDRAITTAIRLAAVALGSGDRVGLLSFGAETVGWLRPDKGRAQIARLLEHVHTLEPERADANFTRALTELRHRQKKRALVVVLTDFVDQEASREMTEVLGILAKKHAILFVALRDPLLRAVADAPAQDLAGTYRAIAAMTLDESRRIVIESLAATGIRALDLTPEAVTQGAVRAYLALRALERL